MVKSEKILGRKAYGSIGHLPGSRLGKGDHKIPEGQAAIITKKPRDKHDIIIVQEKLDGGCVSVAKVEGRIHPLGRAGYNAFTSPFKQHALFGKWVLERQGLFDELLQEGERVVGEWLIQAHGTRYELEHEPFVAFDIFNDKNERLTYVNFSERVVGVLPVPTLVHYGNRPLSIEDALERLGTYGFHGAIDPIEGAVWRAERKGRVDFLAKYVRPDKVDGLFLPEITGGEAVWNQIKN